MKTKTETISQQPKAFHLKFKIAKTEATKIIHNSHASWEFLNFF